MNSEELIKLISCGETMTYRGLGFGIPRSQEQQSQVEFVNDEKGNQFIARIWRSKGNGVDEKSNGADKKSNGVDMKSNGVDMKSNGVAIKLTRKQLSVIEYCKDTPRTSTDILDFVGVTHQRKTFVQYITKLVEAGLLRPIMGKPNSPNQCYIKTNVE